MIIYPAIDLQDGKVVRLYQGDMEDVTVYNRDPVGQAHLFATQGFSWLHVVDLDGAKQGMPSEASIVRNILKTVDIPVQLGGGIRTHNHIEHWLSAGVSRVILGTVAVRDPDLVRQACNDFPGQIAVAMDARNGSVAVDGWTHDANISAIELARHFEDAGVCALIFTDIGRDGTEKGLNVEATEELAETTSIPIIASGGVASLEDIQAVKDMGPKGVEGVIVGKAFYKGIIEPKDALEIAAS